MTNYLTIENILRESEEPISIKTIKKRAEKRGSKLKRERISSILNRMRRRGKVEFKKEQISKRRVKFWEYVK